MYIFVLLYVANYAFHSFEPDTSLATSGIAIVIVAALLYHARVWQIALGGFLLLALGRVVYQHFYQRGLPATYFNYSLNLMVLFMGIGAFFMRGGISIENAQNPNWLAVQEWAKQNSALEDLFIVPPLLKTEGFRVESERSSYGDWKDGTAMFFNPAYGYEWYERMKRLGYVPPDKPEFAFDVIDARLEQGYISLAEDDFLNIAREMPGEIGKVFVVRFREYPPLNFPVVYQNNHFLVSEILPERSHN